MIKLIKEEEKTIIEPVPAPVEQKQDEVDAKMATVACEEAVNNLMQQAWDFISNVNSVITTLELNYKEDSKKDVLELLNVIIDDSTINVGVLQKIINTMNTKKVVLLNAGEDKAEKILEKSQEQADSE